MDDRSNYDRFSDNNGDPVIHRPDDAVSWRELPDPEDALANKGEVYFVGLYCRIVTLHKWRAEQNDRLDAQGKHLLIRMLDEEQAYSSWLDRAIDWLPEWFGQDDLR